MAYAGEETLKVALLRSPYQLELVDRLVPSPGPGEVLVRLRAAGICGSDVHGLAGEHPLMTLPRVLGHELAGQVEAVGSEVARVSPGDHVVVDPMLRCGHCRPCRLGRYNCCESLKVLGVHTDGGFAEFIALPQGQVHPVPESLPWEVGTLVEPLAVGAHGVARSRVNEGDTVVILGAGTIGLAALLAAKQQRAKTIVLDILDWKLERARELGADLVLNSATEDDVEGVMTFTDGQGAEVVLEAAGSPVTVAASVNYVASAGRIGIIGITGQEIPLHQSEFTRKEVDVCFSRNSLDQFPRVIDRISRGEIDPRPMISHRFPFSDVGHALQLARERPQEVGKIVLEFEG
jgi:threonine dehydrogenase-like Zn-dependent dehydrogenase